MVTPQGCASQGLLHTWAQLGHRQRRPAGGCLASEWLCAHPAEPVVTQSVPRLASGQAAPRQPHCSHSQRPPRGLELILSG